ncbi:AAA ATPase [Halocaridina rubra]|uniref:AAA ATPase n=1 Tax=Halocaridina rubra TaxID=373956 RepID=A0AAN8X470_HALRR
MPAKQCTIDFPIRKSLGTRTRNKIGEERAAVSKSRPSRSRSKKNGDIGSSQAIPVREHSSSNSHHSLSENSLERTPTKRKILQDCSQRDDCSPRKVYQTSSQEDKENEKVAISGISLSKSNNENLQNGKVICSPGVVLTPVKLCSPERIDYRNGILTRTQNSLKSLSRVSVNSISSPLRSTKEHQFQSPSKSPLKCVNRLEADRGIKYLDEKIKTISPLKRLDFGSPRQSARKLVLSDNVDSPLKRLDFGSPRQSPRKLVLGNNVNSPLKHLDFGSPRRSPRKLILDNTDPKPSPVKFLQEDDSPRRSPRKVTSLAKYGSPSSLISSLSLTSLDKKKNVAMALFEPNVTAYRMARQSLNAGTPTTLVCRDEQVKAMQKFLSSHLAKGKPGSLYISGAPGTGKTACLNFILENMKNKNIKKAFINCMSLKSSTAIYAKIASELGFSRRSSEKEIVRTLEKSLVSCKNTVLIVLDEIDQLDSKNQEVLYSIFEWPSLKDSRLVLVGIANALDLTDRILPRLQARPNFKPELLHFPPYSKAEIVKIINERLQQANIGDVQIIKPPAIQFLAGKVASVAGDVRKALDVCRRAVELCEIEAKKQSVLKPTIGSPRKSPRKGEKSLKMVDIPQVISIFNEVYGSRVISAVTNAPESFSIQQKLLICCLLLFLKHARSKDITLGKVSKYLCI